MSVNRLVLAGFAASVMVNVFLGSALAGRWLIRQHEVPAHDPDQAAERMAAQLPPADATLLRSAYARHRAEVVQGLAQTAGFPDRLRGALAAEPFDPQALAAVFDANGQGHAALTVALREATLDAVMAMSPEGRRALAGLKPAPVGDR